MKSAATPRSSQPARGARYSNASICVQSACIDSAISTFSSLPEEPPGGIGLSVEIFRGRRCKRHANNPFRMNTYESVSKQRTLTTFRMNTCEKPRGGGRCDYRRLLLLCRSPQWMAIFVRAYVSGPLPGMCNERIGPSGFLFNLGASARSLSAAFPLFNAYRAPAAP